MKAKELVQYDYKNPKGVASYSFGNYKGKNGRTIEYKDINGNPDQITFKGASVLLDMDNEGHVLIDDFLKNNPDVLGGKWIRKDLHAIEKKKTKDTLDSARAIIEAAKMTDKEVIQFATLKRLNLNSEMDVLRAKLIEIAQNDADGFMETHFDPEKDLRVFILEAVREKKLNYRNETFYYGKEAIGTNEEQVLVWLKDNKDILAILKHEIRGENTPNNKTVKAKA
tara:strand:- start:229 stop:903 length:675 start_codon:yes stop_codon:yes gene_type:complete